MDNARALGKGTTFTFENVVYNISPTVLDIQAEFEKRFVAQAFENLRALRPKLGSEYESERSALRRDVDAGHYNFESDLVRTALHSEKTMKLFIYVSLSYSNKDKTITPQLVENIFQAGKASELIEAFAFANESPNDLASQKNTQ
jgi:hypothetical protein